MADSKTVAAQIAARCRRIGWPVVTGSGRAKYLYKITLPDGSAVQIHSSPSDVNWAEHVWRLLNKGGFVEAEEAFLAQEEADKQAKLAADRAAAERKAVRTAAKAAAHNAAIAKAAGPYAPQVADLGWLTTPTEWPETRTVIVTPEIAAKLLLTINTHNRPLRPSRVEFLARIIKAGDWAATHQGGAIDSNVVLQDGQHRLAAICEADIAVPMQWSVGMPPENFRKVDTGANRTAADAAALRNEVDPRLLTTAAKMLLHVEMFGGQAHLKGPRCPLSIDEVDRGIDMFGDDLRAALVRAKEIKKELRKKVNPTSATSAVYLISRAMPPDDPRVRKFFNDFQWGLGLTDRKDPVVLLRRALTNAPEGRKGYGAWEQLALILKAWNWRAINKRQDLLFWRPTADPLPSVMLPSQMSTGDSEEAA